MEYNTCKTCGANDGRAGMLLSEEGSDIFECINCHTTRKTGEVFIDTSLSRTPKEIKKTMAILDKHDISDSIKRIVKTLSEKIAKADGRPAHPEDYETMAEFLLSKKDYEILFNRITTLASTPSCHTPDMFSFADFWIFVLRDLTKSARPFIK